MLLVSTLYAALFPRIACSPLTSVSYELLTGSLLYCSIFYGDRPGYFPAHQGRALDLGPAPVFCSCSCVCLALMNRAPAFAVLLANALVPCLDRLVCSGGKRAGSLYKRQKKLEELKGWKETAN